MDFSVLIAIISGSLLAIVGISFFLAYTGVGQFIGHILTVFGHVLQVTFGTLFAMVASAPSYVKIIFFLIIFSSFGAFSYGATIGVTKACVDGDVYDMDYTAGLGALMVENLGTTVLKLEADQSVEVSGDSVDSGNSFASQYGNETYVLIPDRLGNYESTTKQDWKIKSAGFGDDGFWFWQEKNSLKYMLCRQYEDVPNGLDKLTGACVAWPVADIRIDENEGGGCSELDQYSPIVNGRPKYYFDRIRGDTKGVTLGYDGTVLKVDIDTLPSDQYFEEACTGPVKNNSLIGVGKTQVRDVSFSREIAFSLFRSGSLFGYGGVENYTYSIDNLREVKLAVYKDQNGEKKLAADSQSLSSYYNTLSEKYYNPYSTYVKDNGDKWINSKDKWITYTCNQNDKTDRNETLLIFGFPLFTSAFMISLIVVGILVSILIYLRR